MNNERISIRYAKSIYVLSEQQNNLETILKDMKIVLSLIKESKDFKNFLLSPILKPNKKIEIIENILGSQVSKETIQHITLITNNSRESFLDQIIINFIKIYKKQKNILSVKIKSPYEINKEQKDLIVKYLGYSENQKIDFQIEIDKKIIGGLIVETEGKQLDISILSKLQALKTKFSKNLYIKQY